MQNLSGPIVGREFSVRRLYTELRRAYRAAKREPFSTAANRAQLAALSALRTLTNDWEPGVFGQATAWPSTTCQSIKLKGEWYYRPRVSNTTIRTLRRWNTLPLPSP